MISKKIAQYNILLQKYGPKSKEVIEFEKTHENDRPLKNRIKNLKKYFT